LRTKIKRHRTNVVRLVGAKSDFRNQTDKIPREMPEICAESRWHINCFLIGSDFEPRHTN